ncbi:uncharacterized protein LOC27206194 [Drosophila simulans]|uniref:GD11900 n=1 Tax=Drosophila simulans TaxID=7240 RepID=B4QCK8_DROSI|nr:uncharacterized protein LOC27206194 [Drosophila simulans]EDX08624.1 GD11900 [Drosophila simulans]KMY96445.1 uncharacterized protein Dsimw501_GD11900 [Drosophila simulans]
MWFLLVLLGLPMETNEGAECSTGLTLGRQQCYLHEEIFLAHHPLQSVTAKRLKLPWWCALLESLFLLLLVKLLQL